MDEARKILLKFDEGLLTIEEAKAALDVLAFNGELWPGTAAAFKIELERGRQLDLGSPFKGGPR